MPSDSKLHEYDDCDDKEHVPFVPPPMSEVIEVQFTEDAPSGVEQWDFGKDKEYKEHQGKKPSGAWPKELREILAENQFASWKPSFPLEYPWSPKCPKDAQETPRESYKKAGRDKFITLKFSRNADVISIAEQLRKRVPGIVRVVAVPKIVPPHIQNAPQPASALSNPLAEPYVGKSDEAEPIFCGPTGCLTSQWYLFRCGVPEAWAQKASGKGVVIADIDWGFDLTHPDLMRTQLSQNMFTGSPNVSDGNLLFHGNGVLGLAGAAINGQGMAGIAHRATLWAVQAGTGAINQPVVNHQMWVDAINFVRFTPAPGPKVIILELQTAGYSNAESIPSINLEIREAIKDGIVVCVPAGNGNRTGRADLDDFDQPIEETFSIVVGATRYDTDPERNVRAGSNGGERVTVYAPGDSESDVTCGIRGRYRDNFGGTSGATAKVAGVVALILEKNKALKPQDVRDILRGSPKRAFDEPGDDVGAFLDANHAVSEAIRRLGTAQGTVTTTRTERSENALQAA